MSYNLNKILFHRSYTDENSKNVITVILWSNDRQ